MPYCFLGLALRTSYKSYHQTVLLSRDELNPTYLGGAHALLGVPHKEAFDKILRLGADRRPRVVVKLVSTVLQETGHTANDMA